MLVRTIYVPADGGPVLNVGRAPTNDVVVHDRLVSLFHAMIWCRDDQAWIRDIGSRNGTFVDGERVTEAMAVPDGALVTFGPEFHVRLTLSKHDETTPLWQVQDLVGGATYALHSDRFVIGPGGDLPLDVEVATLELDPSGVLTVDQGGARRRAKEGEIVDGGGARFRVTRAPVQWDATHEAVPEVPPCRIEAELDGSTGPNAVVTDLATGASARFGAEHRAILLYMLAKRRHEDVGKGTDLEDTGWVEDSELLRGIYGRAWMDKNANALHVLVHRVRKDLESAGLDPWIIEKGGGYTRVCASVLVLR